MKHSLYRAFTLVELIVVVTILSILATLAYIGVDNYFASTRDSKRIYDMQQMTNVMQLYFNGSSEYPEPSNYVELTYSGSLAWKQGTFWESVTRTLRSFWNDIPLDPLYNNEYTYSLTNGWLEYQIGMIRETFRQEEDLGELISFQNKAHAWSIPWALVAGNYNGFVVRVIDGPQNYFLATPSIIAANLDSTDVLDVITWQNLVYDNFFNLPASYSEYIDTRGGFDFNVSDPLVFSWSLNDLRNEQNLLDFDARLKYVYTTTPTESFARYISLLQQDTLTNIKRFLTQRFKILFRSYFNCLDILSDGASRGDGDYEIDPEWNGDVYTVYCDMTTDGGWWTRVWDNHLLNADFSWGTHIYWAEQETSLQHSIVPLSAEVDENTYALRQTGNYSSHYRLWFPDTSILRQWYEIRMSAWRSDSSEEGATEVTLMGWKNSPWTLGTCTSWTACFFQNFNSKLLHAPNFWPWGLLSDIQVQVKNPVANVTTNYLDGGVLFDGFIPKSTTPRNISSWWNTYTIAPYTQAEKQAIDAWVQAGGFLISTNNESTWDPLWDYFGMPTIQYPGNSVIWDIENIDHPLVNGNIGLWVDIRGQSLVWAYARAALWGAILPGDIILARDRYAPHLPTVLLRRHGQGYILFVSDDGMFMQMGWGNTFDASNNQTVFASNIMTFAIETAAWINPRDGYIFHNRLYYNDGTFSLNGKDVVLDTITVDDNGTPRTWVKEQVRHRISKTPENFVWYLGLDANNNKEIYYTWLSLELYYR